MSHLSTLAAEPCRRSAGRVTAGAGRDDLVALTRALVFTKEAYRTLRTKAAPPPTPPAGHHAPVLQVAGGRESYPIAAAQPARPLTPWDLMDEVDSPEGVTFATFQRRPQPSERLVQDAA